MRKKICCSAYKDATDEQYLEVQGVRIKGRMVCKHCGKFWRWSATEQSKIVFEKRQQDIDWLLTREQDPKKLAFLRNIRNQMHISPRQYGMFIGIQRDHSVILTPEQYDQLVTGTTTELKMPSPLVRSQALTLTDLVVPETVEESIEVDP